MADSINFDQSGKDVFEELRIWGEETFGQATAQQIFDRTMDEVKELETEVPNGWTPATIEEAADVVLLLTRVPGLWNAMRAKMEINIERKWQCSGNGTGFHHQESFDQAHGRWKDRQQVTTL